MWINRQQFERLKDERDTLLKAVEYWKSKANDLESRLCEEKNKINSLGKELNNLKESLSPLQAYEVTYYCGKKNKTVGIVATKYLYEEKIKSIIFYKGNEKIAVFNDVISFELKAIK